ncbi:ShlB/FhaC/HecB family hemolysin secretion/activation protein [Sphingomonas gilva]|uniref:ShlB/FhaC/HecB family hemolysin secretion/activation protein n=1 Tax=Sphingomonas gilva TaxID=2305907 RepID=A0A396RK94_9SPHN|nr:ShlB/FhaC/HecB family hemolysin secretion/activation protein [Sphingomonas gilva]RHW16459.1 ShlB/FhaC/HecB family hemolysin secretion/activation protein [Sphingomonas gilva]
MPFSMRSAAIAIIFLAAGAPAVGQSTLDRVDPSKVERYEDREHTPAPADGLIATPAPDRAPTPDTATVRIGGVHVAGLVALRQADFADIVDGYLGKTATNEELAALADQIADRARDKGYVLASARIDPQPLKAGILEIVLDEGVVDEVRVEGTSSAAVRRALSPLASGSPVRMADLERRLLLAGDIAGVRMGKSRVIQSNGRKILVVEASHHPITGWGGVDNDGTSTLGPVAVNLTVDVNGVATGADSLRLTAYNTLFEPQELGFVRAQYSSRIHSSGTEVSLTGSWSRSEPGAYLSPAEIVGKSWFGSIGAAQPLLRRRSASLWLNASLDVRDVRQRKADIPVRRDRLTVLRASVYANIAVFGGRLRSNIAVSQGIDAFDATRPGDPLASRFDAGARFTAATVWADWTSRRYGDFSLNAAVLGQVADGPLLLTEELGLGGSRLLRAYDYSERSGDRGAIGSVEVRYDMDGVIARNRGAQAYIFADGGSVSNSGHGFGGGSLASAGGGIRAGILPFTDAGVEIAIPLSGKRYDSGNEHPRFRFSITRRF